MENKRMRSSANTNLVLKKGAWTVEEDMLLKNCIEKFGEGKWHLVPPRAGLNRCRKSCRLRWLNYLRPNIKRGDFEDDEVDLMLRLHKLLGNRWSLIAGRLPGRTANDVKNYWNTHLKPRPKQQKERLKESEPLEHTMVTIIKPQARTTSKAFNFYQNITSHDPFNIITSSNMDISSSIPEVVSSPTLCLNKINEYVDELFCDEEREIDNRVGWSFAGFSVDRNSLDIIKQVDGQNNLYDFSIDDIDMLDLLD